MRLLTRSLCAALLALLGTVILTVSWAMTTSVQLQATTALIMGGRDHSLGPPKDQPPFVTAYLDNAVNSYINAAAAAGTGTSAADNAVAVVYPAEFFPVAGSLTFDQSVAIGRANVHNCLKANAACDFNNDPAVDPQVGSDPPQPTDTFIVFGYSESAVIAALVKRDLIDNHQASDPSTSFEMVANAMRPNGGILERGAGLPTIPFFGITFYGAAPTDSPVVNDGGTPNDPTDDTYLYPTIDVAQQYDGLGGDFPVRPLNLLATFNAIAGFAYLHGNVINRPLSDAQFQGKMGDTTYYLFTSDTLPILMPLDQIGVPKPIVRLLDAPLRVLIEDAYARDVNPGTPTPASILPIGNPIALALHLLASIPVGIDDALQELGIGRALGTTPAGPFGVGGPALPPAPTATTTTTTTTTTMSTLSAPAVEQGGTESAAPHVNSLTSRSTSEPTATTAPTTSNNTDVKPASVEPTATATPSASPTATPTQTAKPQVNATTPETKSTPSATEPDRPKVRGPIEFDSQKHQTESPSSPSGQQASGSEPSTGSASGTDSSENNAA
ncbi:PE-PPE domain-containing protein [Mycobacterium sp.]|uniref:PE-PPE domain-containing protein n=1 Tax=Mycobacterium sp. TaxID=1785 RepID=UPI002B6140CD|nr:PE-PPE domain-containing protein [Mycobacterium sp.]HKP40588.1 PE-PPE domain-containing protein [Mycobacterium sp.]